MAKEKKKKKKNRQSESVDGSERFVGRPNGYLGAETPWSSARAIGSDDLFGRSRIERATARMAEVQPEDDDSSYSLEAPAGETPYHWYGDRESHAGGNGDASEAKVAGATGLSLQARDRLRRLWTVSIPPHSASDPAPEEPEPEPQAEATVAVAADQPARRGEELELLRSMAAGIERIAESIDALRMSMDEVRTWATSTGALEIGERDLGKLVINAELLVERGIEDAEERARAILANASEQAAVIFRGESRSPH